MFLSLKLLVLKFWSFWIGIFAPLPFGDPYLATAVLFVFMTVGCTMMVKQDLA